jgi:hypothetical protein
MDINTIFVEWRYHCAMDDIYLQCSPQKCLLKFIYKAKWPMATITLPHRSMVWNKIPPVAAAFGSSSQVVQQSGGYASTF